ncbi:hypothetical protein ACSBR2_038982 [Camellia fascicularis]
MPDDILSCILSFLSIRDSVKARILSRRWRYICPFMLNLDFDLHTVLRINYKARYSNGDSDMSWEDKSKFVTGVDQFLELYNGQKLDSLRICFCLGNEYAGYVDRWIRFAIIMKTEKLDLDFSASPESQSNNLYDFPCQLLPQGDSSQLKYLCLKSCNLGPTPNLVSRLISLKSLDLEHVPLNQSCADSILSSCLNLEWLRLKNSILPETLCIHGPSLHLKILIVHECYGVQKFKISSIGLTTFEYIGKVKNFSFLDVPRLEKVHIRFMVAYERGTQYMFNGIANDLPRLQTLSLVLTTDEYSKHVHCELKEVEVHGFLGRSNEMELAIYLLKNVVSLERMILSTQKRLHEYVDMSSTGEINDVIDLSPETPSGPKGNDLKPIDRLTEMPDDILSCILSFLSIRDSVKARILSRRWRYICPFMLNLDFDLHTVLGINYKARYSNGDSDMSWEDKSKFVTGVDQFLELYNGQKLDSLRICFCLGNEYAGYVDRWIRFAIIMKTEKLDLDFSASPESQSNNLYDFPCQLLPQGDSSQLKYLCLKSCNLGPTPNLVSRLISLKSLDLEHVPLNQSCADSILSSCLNLEWLRLKNSILPETLCINGPSLHLKILIVHECYGVEKFEISSIGLTTFEYIGKVKNFSFLDVPRLEKVHIRFMVAYERGTQYMFNGIANDLPRLQTLSLVLTTDEVLPIPARITRFNSLKQLELFVMVSSDFNLLSLTSLLNASPLLQKLHLSLHTGRSRGRRIELQYSKHVHCELKEVEVHGFLGRSNEMELAIYLLKNAVSLERMILSTQKRLYHGGGKWTSSRCPWFEWQRKKACAYDLLQKEKVNSHTELLFL